VNSFGKKGYSSGCFSVPCCGRNILTNYFRRCEEDLPLYLIPKPRSDRERSNFACR